MKPILLIFLGIFLISCDPTLSDLSVDHGPSWDKHYVAYNFDSSWIVKGNEFYRDGNYVDAIQSYSEATKSAPEPTDFDPYGGGYLDSSCDIKNHMGDAYFKLGQNENALASYIESTDCARVAHHDREPELQEHLLDQAIALLALEEYHSALDIFYNLTSNIDNENADYWHGYALALSKLGRLDESLTSYNVSLKLNSSDASI